jgi:NAD(P)-dependent dehydrogenase (short-subunit alcohol dehydrogenase family)
MSTADLERPINERVALVTGATRGIGSAIAERLVADGARVAVNGRDRGALEEVAARLVGGAGADRLMRLLGDVTDQRAVERMVADVVDRFGKLDVLVNAAGVAGPIGVPVEALEPADFEDVMATNLTGVFLCCRAAIPALVSAGGGRIVNIASTSGLRGEPGRAGYVSSKWALRGLTRTLAVELGPRGVTANTVCPHFTLGERTERIARETARIEGVTPEALIDRVRAETAMGAILDGSDTAGAVAFLVSPAGRYVTGQDIVVDAGCVI